MLDPTEADTIRATVRTLAHGTRRFHWRNEESKDRRKAAGVLGAIESLHVVVVGTGLDNARQERGRRQCLERLMWELSAAGVSHVWMDARRPHQNRRDLAFVGRLRGRGILPDDLAVDFAQAGQEPLTWMPDIVAGAVGAALREGEFQYLVALESVLSDVITIELT